MAGNFYPPPPPFVGGNQPLAGHNDIPQSGMPSVPSYAPITAATFAIILASWVPGPNPTQRAPQIPQSGPSPIPVQPLASAISRIIVSTWDDNIWTVVHVNSITSSGAPNPPITPLGLTNLRLLVQAWDTPPPLPQQSPPFAALLPQPSTTPPPISGALFASLIALNQPPPYAIPRAGTVASWVPVPSQPPPSNLANLRLTLQAWDLPGPLPPRGGTIAHLIPKPSPPPRMSYVNLGILIDSWRPPVWWPLPSLTVFPTNGPLPIPIGSGVVWFLAQPSLPVSGNMNTIINPDAEYYVGPQPEIGINPTFPLWMYNAAFPAQLVNNLAEMNALIASGPGWVAMYLPPFGPPPVPPTPQISVAATVPSGNVDSFDPVGWQPGYTTRLVMQPADATSTLLGLDATGVVDGWKVEILNVSTTIPLTFSNSASATPGNSFFLSGGGAQAQLAVQSATWIEWVEALNGWMFLG